MIVAVLLGPAVAIALALTLVPVTRVECLLADEPDSREEAPEHLR
jgi:hypothetical protein